MSMKIPNIVRKKVTPIMLPVNALNIMPRPELVPEMNFTSNAMLKNGVMITDIKQLLALFRNTSMNNVRTDNPFIKIVKPITLALAVNSVIQTLVLPVKS